MVIGFEAKRAAANYTGLGNYSRYIVDSMAQCCPNQELRLYVPKQYSNVAYQKLLSYSNVKSILPDKKIASLCRPLWRSHGMIDQLRRDGVDLFHGLSNEIPIGIESSGITSVVTIHDLIFLRYPSFYGRIDRNIYNAKFRYACRHANRIVAVSECTKRDIVKFYDIDPDKIDVIYQGCNPIFAKEVSESEVERVRMAYNLPEKYILNVGTIEKRKNVLLAIKALPSIDPEYHMIIIGRKTPYMQEINSFIKSAHLADRVHFIHDMDLTDLPIMYHLAKLFVFPSRYEGFGIPVLEAITAGIPVISATGSCLEEAGGAASIYVDPDNVQEMADAMQRVLSDDALRSKMIEEGKLHTLRFDSALMITSLMETYKKAMESK